MSTCPSCDAEILDIDVRCSACGTNLASTGAHRMVGNTVLGQYEILEVLGQGGMSVVYRGRHAMTDQEVALKVLPPDLAAYSQVKSRFLEEARALAQLDHPNIVHLYNFGQEGGSFVLAMQYVHGQTWERQILEGGPQEWPIAVRICIDVLRALEYAHNRGVVHRDMKPSNVLVRDDDGTATVMDFGIAKMTTSTRLTATGQTMGTVRYMSPEQVRGQEVDLRSDIYSLGATLYEAVVGETPFDGNTHFEIMTKHLSEAPPPPSSLDVVLPVALEDAIMCALSKKVEDRFDTARDMRKALEAVLAESDVGLAETQRMSRDAVAAARTVVRRGAGSAPISLEDRVSPIDSTRDLGGLADRLEPDDGDADGEAVVPTGSRGTLWLALSGVVLAAAIGVAAFLIVNRGSAQPPADAAAVQPPGEFQPPDVRWRQTTSYAADGIVVRIADPIDWDPGVVAMAYRKVRAAVPAVTGGRALPAYPPHLAIQVVPRQVLCDPRTFEGDAPADCKDLYHYFRIRERTLLIVDDRALLEPILAQAVAEIACVFDEITPCFAAELVEAVKAQPGGQP